MCGMSMGKRRRDRQPAMWVSTTELPTAASHPFYRRLNQLLREHGFDDFVETQCASFYAESMGRPSLPPGIYFRLLLIGYFEGIDSERGIAWRAADSLALRDFFGVGLEMAPPDHSTISRTRRLIDVEACRSRIRLSGGDRQLDKVVTVGNPPHMPQIGRGHRVSAGEGQRRAAVQ